MEGSELKSQVEALLFSAGRALSNEDMARMIGVKSKDAVADKARELKKDYSGRDSPIMISEESDGWKMTVRERYLSLVREINPYTELSKTVMETLAVVAWKSPVLQSTVINIRTNKAYDHISELEELGFIIKEKYGRTYMLKLTQKFFEYFDLKDKKDISKLFKGLKDSDELEAQLKVDEFEQRDEAVARIVDELSDEDEAKKMDDEDVKVIDEISELEAGGDNLSEKDEAVERLADEISRNHSEPKGNDINQLEDIEVIDDPEKIIKQEENPDADEAKDEEKQG